MSIELVKFPYKYMEYEKILQERELYALIPEVKILSDSKDRTVISCDSVNMDKLKELTYYCSFQINGVSYSTRQGLLEQDNTLCVTKQQTRYSTHGIHEYKGKFNPQIVHAIMNIFNIQHGQTVLDPFSGSGTTILECAHAGIEAYGTDINPMACFIANAKISALKVNVSAAYNVLEKLINKLSIAKPIGAFEEDERLKYLKHWIPSDTLCILETLRGEMSNEEKPLADLLLIVASDLIRDYSYQEPTDLRIRRRKSPLPKISFLDAYNANVHKYLRKIEIVQSIEDINLFPTNYAINCNIKETNPFVKMQFDAAITSPPYVTALPYIDTQRLSIVWLGLCNASGIGKLEAALIGSRELLKSEKDRWAGIIEKNNKDLPSEIYTMVISMHNSLSEKDGFRKQAVPTLVYKYFSEMKEMFINVKTMLKQDARYGLVVGHNKTMLGEKKYNIDTPELLAILAEDCGWDIEEIFPLQTYKRYGLNSKNAINKESLIILKNTGSVK